MKCGVLLFLFYRWQCGWNGKHGLATVFALSPHTGLLTQYKTSLIETSLTVLKQYSGVFQPISVAVQNHRLLSVGRKKKTREFGTTSGLWV